MTVSYTSKTLDYLRKELKLDAEVVERWIMGVNIRKDLFNIIDIIGIDGDFTYGVQSTSWACRKDHIEKIEVTHKDTLIKWLSSPCRRFFLITWKKKKIKRGGIAYKYVPVIEQYRLTASNILLELIDL